MDSSRYHRAIRHIEKNANTIRVRKMANALLSNRSRDVWIECDKMKGKTCNMASMIDGNSSGVVVVERLERSLQFLLSRVERRSSSCFTCFLLILLISCRNWHLT